MYVKLLSHQHLAGRLFKKNRTYPLSKEEVDRLSPGEYVIVEDEQQVDATPISHQLEIDPNREAGVRIHKVDGNTGDSQDITDQGK
jgi:hypothetical protein